MGKTGFDKFLTVLLVILVGAVIACLVFLIGKYFEKNQINSDADKYIEQNLDPVLEEISSEYDEQIAINEQTATTGPRGIDTNKLIYKGYKVEGKLEMPSVNLQYPVLEQMTDINELEVSIAIQYGVGLNKVGNTILIGHNYRSGLFFGSNKNMQLGDSIYITDSTTGKRIEYKIYDKYTVEESDTSYFNRDTEGKREVTLVTCQSNNKYRLIIKAREV